MRCVIGGNRILHARTIKIGPRHHLDVVVVVKDGVLRDGDLAQGLCAREPVPLLFQPLIHTSVLFIALIDHGCKEVILRLGFLTAGRTLPVMIAGMKTTRACSPSSVWMVEEATGRLLPKQRRTVPPKRMHPAGGTDGAAGPFKRTPLAPRLGPRHAVLHITVAIPVSSRPPAQNQTRQKAADPNSYLCTLCTCSGFGEPQNRLFWPRRSRG